MSARPVSRKPPAQTPPSPYYRMDGTQSVLPASHHGQRPAESASPRQTTDPAATSSLIPAPASSADIPMAEFLASQKKVNENAVESEKSVVKKKPGRPAKTTK